MPDNKHEYELCVVSKEHDYLFVLAEGHVTNIPIELEIPNTVIPSYSSESGKSLRMFCVSVSFSK